MATEKLGLAPSLERKAFRAVEAILRENPVLSRRDTVKTWGALRGAADSAVHTATPAIAMMPMIRLQPGHRDDRPAGKSSATTLVVQVETFVPGLDADDILDLWGAIREAMVGENPHGNSNVYRFLNRAIGAEFSINYDVTVPGFGAFRSRSDDNATFLSGVGQIEISFFRPR